ncbi:unnamed protein product [Prunus armeniaca]
MSACQPVDTPIEEGLKLEIEVNQVSTNKGRYQREKHMNAMMRILSYLKAAPGKEILFTKDDKYLKIKGYTNADWASDVGDRRSTSGYFTFVGGNLVT